MSEYNATEKSIHAIEEAQAAIGRRARLTLTGTIVGAGVSDSGAFVKLKVDSRWGFGEDFRLVMDLDPLELDPLVEDDE